ncbi:unnamed protein product [Adineta ricciae]|uniref:G-protein coupled receptors family 1 profile domain-containing protein n=1 Tax=Adineta ricciae TaxID=249248 RepID=A0A815VVY2_ADIRI|nr:unnamed protein product [Adineta ricciae]
MSSTQTILEQALYQMTKGFVPFLLLLLGAFGSLGNIITFTSRSLRNNSCAFYFLSTATFELLTVSFGLISRIADQFGSLLQSQSRIYCKVRYYFALLFPTVATYLLLMVTIDRCLSTSANPRYRSVSQIKVAYRMVPFVIILCMIACSHTLVFVDHRPSCLPEPGPYSLFYSIYLISFSSVLPNLLLLVFGFWTISNIRKARYRTAPSVAIIEQQQRNRQNVEAQFIAMVVSQGIVSCIIDLTRMSCYAYYLLTANQLKSSYQQIVDTFIFQFSIVLSYFNYSESFYTNTLTNRHTSITGS